MHKRNVLEGQKLYGCEKCEKQFAQNADLKKHVKSVHHVTTSINDQNKKIQEIFHEELQFEHQNPKKNKQREQKKILKKNSKRNCDFQCPECNMTFSQKKKILPHLKSVHQKTCDEKKIDQRKNAIKNNMPKQQKKPTSENSESFKCSQCTSVYRTEKNLQIHKIRFHVDKHKDDSDNCSKEENEVKPQVQGDIEKKCICCRSEEATCKFITLYQLYFDKWKKPLEKNLDKAICDKCYSSLEYMYIFPKSDYSKSVSKPYSEGGIELPKITKADLKKLMSLKSTINKKKELKKAFSRKT